MATQNRVDKLKDALLDPKPRTAEVTRPHEAGLRYYNYVNSWRIDKLPPFNIWTADVMRFDPQVSFGVQIRNGPLTAAEVTVEGPVQRVNEWVQKAWNRIWETSAHKLLRTKIYGYMGYEVMYREDSEGLIAFDSFREMHPTMVRPLTRHNETLGIMVRPYGSYGGYRTIVGEDDFEQPATVLAPKCLWTTFEGRFENPWGEPLLEHSYGAWWEKWMEHGAKRSAMLRMLKDAWIGDIFYYPANVTLVDADGEKVSWRDIFREMGENRLSGGMMLIPMLRDANGQQLTQYQPPHGIPGETAIFDWQERLNIEIWKGMEIPREVIEAASTGSGFSGRAIPLVTFVSLLMREFQEIMTAVDRMILRPIAHLNFGVKPDYQLKAMDVNGLIQKLTGGSSQASMGGAGIGMGAMMAGAGAGGTPFSEDTLEPAHRRLLDDIGIPLDQRGPYSEMSPQFSEQGDIYADDQKRVLGKERPGRSGAPSMAGHVARGNLGSAVAHGAEEQKVRQAPQIDTSRGRRGQRGIVGQGTDAAKGAAGALWRGYNALPYTAEEIAKEAGVSDDNAELARKLMAAGQMAPGGTAIPASVIAGSMLLQPKKTMGAIRRAMKRVKGT